MIYRVTILEIVGGSRLRIEAILKLEKPALEGAAMVILDSIEVSLPQAIILQELDFVSGLCIAQLGTGSVSSPPEPAAVNIIYIVRRLPKIPENVSFSLPSLHGLC